jgi:hypothetical protein
MVIATQITASDGTTLSPVSGSVTMDSRRSITRTADLDLTATTTRSAAQIYDLVMTPGLEITIKRGLKLADGTFEYVPLGIFSTDTASITRGTSGTVRWNGSDRSKKISRARFTDPYQITAGTNLATAGTDLLRSRWPLTPVSFDAILDTVTAQLIFEAGESSDPWEQARNLFADYGYDLNFDGEGTARAVVIPDPSITTATFDFGSGATNLVMGAESAGSLENTFNGVIASGEGSDVALPTRGEAWDDNPLSPTYYLGSYGKVPLFYSSPLLTTQQIAQTAANSILAKLKGRVDGLSWSTVVNPALEPLDVIQMNVGGTTYKAVIDQLTIPLKATDAMTATARLAL